MIRVDLRLSLCCCASLPQGSRALARLAAQRAARAHRGGARGRERQDRRAGVREKAEVDVGKDFARVKAEAVRAAELKEARDRGAQGQRDANAAKEAASARATRGGGGDRARSAEQDADAALADAQEQLDRAILEATDSGRGLHLDEERTCVVCYDDFIGFSDGVECDCADAHFVCNECFVASVRSSITDTPAKQALRDGHIYCPYATFPPTQQNRGRTMIG